MDEALARSVDKIKTGDRVQVTEDRHDEVTGVTPPSEAAPAARRFYQFDLASGGSMSVREGHTVRVPKPRRTN